MALERSELLFVSQPLLLGLAGQWPQVCRNLAMSASRAATASMWMAVQSMLASPEMRLAQRLSVALQWAHTTNDGKWVTLRKRVSHELLARMPGLSRPRHTMVSGVSGTSPAAPLQLRFWSSTETALHLDLWLVFVAAATVLLANPGPTILTVISYSATHGKRSTLPLIAGVALGDSTALVISLVGLGALLAASAVWFNVVKWAGGLYLLYLRIKMLCAGTSGHVP